MVLRLFRAFAATVPTLRTCFSTLPTLGFTTFQGFCTSVGPCDPPKQLAPLPVMLSCPSKPSLRTQRRCPVQPARRHHLNTVGSRHHPCRSPDRDFHRRMYTAFLPLSLLPAFRGWEVAFSSPARSLNLRVFLRVRVRCASRGCPLDRPVASMGLNDSTLSHASPGCPSCARSKVIVCTSKTVREERLSVRTPGLAGCRVVIEQAPCQPQARGPTPLSACLDGK